MRSGSPDSPSKLVAQLGLDTKFPSGKSVNTPTSMPSGAPLQFPRLYHSPNYIHLDWVWSSLTEIFCLWLNSCSPYWVTIWKVKQELKQNEAVFCNAILFLHRCEDNTGLSTSEVRFLQHGKLYLNSWLLWFSESPAVQGVIPRPTTLASPETSKEMHIHTITITILRSLNDFRAH